MASSFKLACALLAATLLVPSIALGDVRINEIMAANTLSVEDEDGSNSDWIELANHGATPADLSGYFLTDDPTNPELWQFPLGTTIAPGDTLLVFASNKNRTTPGEEIHTNFRLDNDGEYLALVFPDGTTIVDSIEPTFPPLPADITYGLNPAADRFVYFTTPTPDAPNNAGAPSIGLIVRDTLDSPALTPADTSLVLTTTVLRRGNAGPVSTVHAFVRTNYSPELVPLIMADDGQAPDETAGDEIYTVAVPLNGLAPGDMLRWRIEATTFGGLVTSNPPYPDSRQSPQYFGTMVQDPNLTTNLPALHWFIQSPTRANNTTGTRCSLFFNGEFYDNVFVRTRGGSTSGLEKKSYKFDFNPGYKFKFHPDEGRVEEFNLNTTATDKTYIRQSLAYDVYDLCGAPGGVSFPMHVRQNGSFFSVAAFIEQPDDDLLDREGLDDRGALYKMFNNFSSATSRVEKKNRTHENSADLNNFIRAMRNKTGDALDNAIFDHVDTPRMLNYLVGNTLTANGDSMSKNHYLYRDSDGTGEWTFLPWDLDLTFGRHYMTADNIRDDTIWADEDWVLGGRSRNVPIAPSHPFMGSRSYPGNRSYNQLIDRLFTSDRFIDMFRRRFRTIIDEILQPLDTPAGDRLLESLIDSYATQIGTDAATDLAKWRTYGQRQTMAQAIAILKTDYLDVRRQHLFVTHHADNVATYPFPANQAESLRFPDAQSASAEINLVSAEPSPASGNQLEEFVQLFNPNATPVDLSGWKITGGIRHTFRPGTVIESAASLFLAKSATAFRARTTTPTGGEGHNIQDGYSGQLSARGETVTLQRPDATVASTLTSTPKPSPQQQHLRITELAIAPSGGKSFEWLELHNTSTTTTLDLAGVHFSDGLTFTFPPGTTLAPGTYAVLVADPTAFASAHGDTPAVLGTYTGNLDNRGEQLTLRDATGENIQSFHFDGDWFSPARNSGYTLQISDPSLPWDDWDLPATWDLSLDTSGTPGTPNPPEVSTSYQAWARTNLEPDATPTSVLRYALADTPLTISPDQTITLTRPANARDLSYSLQITTDLKSWTNLPLTPIAPPSTNGDGTETLYLTLPEAENIARISVVLHE
ncbi:MAG: lamin tail domain-containing protein [Verrucomicrobiales bacterium]|nr:lamin tail domain-containing protein [Verrucomicrobiales bacterium]